MNILLVEDSAPIRAQLRELLLSVDGAVVVGEAESEQHGIELALQLRPDLVLLDLSLAPGHGFNVLRQIRERACAAAVLVLTHQPLPAYRRLSEELGADGFYDKSFDIDQAIDHVRRLAAAAG